MKILKSAALLQMALITQLGMAQAQEHPMGFFVTSMHSQPRRGLRGAHGALTSAPKKTANVAFLPGIVLEVVLGIMHMVNWWPVTWTNCI